MFPIQKPGTAKNRHPVLFSFTKTAFGYIIFIRTLNKRKTPGGGKDARGGAGEGICMEKERISVNRGWLFALTEDPRAVEREFDDSGWRRLDLPHDWQMENSRDENAPAAQGFWPREGVGVYRYRFTPPEDWRGRSVRVLLDGVQRFSEIWLNGVRVGGRPYGYVPVLWGGICLE